MAMAITKSLLSLFAILLAFSASYAATPSPAPSATKPGGWRPIQDLSDPYVQEIAKFAVSEANKQSGKHYTYVKVLIGQSQVVSGMNYNLSIQVEEAPQHYHRLDALVYDRPWDTVRNLVSFQLVESLTTTPVVGAPAFGTWTDIQDVKDPHVQDLAKFAVGEINGKSGKRFNYLYVVSGQKQVVSGMNYKLQVKVKGSYHKLYTFEVVVWEKAGQPSSFELTSFRLVGPVTSKPAPAPAPVPAALGRPETIKDVSTPYVQGVAKFAVAEISKKANKSLVYVKVVSGEVQVVAGSLYTLLIKVKEDSHSNTYEAVVWDKPWENFRELTSYKLKA